MICYNCNTKVTNT